MLTSDGSDRADGSRDHMLSNVDERWFILAVLFLARTAMGFQFQAVAALSSSVITDFSIDYTQLGLLIGLYLFPGIVIAYLEHVPPELNRQDSHGVLDRRFYRH
jgi:hypothetical protein